MPTIPPAWLRLQPNYPGLQMGSILSSISDDEDEYHSLCQYYQEKQGELYSEHYLILRKWRKENRPAPQSQEDLQKQKEDYEAEVKRENDRAQALRIARALSKINACFNNVDPLTQAEIADLVLGPVREYFYYNQDLPAKACAEIYRLREQVRRLETRLQIAESRSINR